MLNQPKREIGSFGLLLLSLSAIFGSGWLFAPFFAAQIAGPGALIAWCVGGIISIVIGLTMAEVITLLPKSGGLNAVIQTTHGRLIGFLVNVLILIICIFLPALEVRAIIQYLGSQGTLLITADHQITFFGYLCAGLLLFLINWVNVYGAKITAYLSTASVGFKLITPLAICFCFLFALYQKGGIDHSHLALSDSFSWQDIFLAISTSGIIFSYNGFNQATLFAAEAKNPQKSIPFAILGSILLTGLLYFFIQYVFLVSVPKSALLQGWNALHFAGDSGPFSGLAVLLGLHVLLYFIYADAIISPLGTAFAYSSTTPRMLYAFAEHLNYFPILRRLNNKGVPTFAIFLSMFLSFMAFILTPNLKAMISILVAAFVLNYTVAPVSLLLLRRTSPDLSRPFKVPFAIIFCYFSLFFSQVMVFCCGFHSLQNLIVVISIAYIFGIILLRYLKENPIFAIKTSLWFLIQLALLVVIAYLNENKIISFIQAIGSIGFLSLFILIFSLRHSRASQFISRDLEKVKLEEVVAN